MTKNFELTCLCSELRVTVTSCGFVAQLASGCFCVSVLMWLILYLVGINSSDRPIRSCFTIDIVCEVAGTEGPAAGCN